MCTKSDVQGCNQGGQFHFMIYDKFQDTFGLPMNGAGFDVVGFGPLAVMTVPSR